MRISAGYVNLGASGFVIALLVAVAATAGLIFCFRYAAQSTRSARSIDAVRVAAGRASRLSGTLLGIRFLLVAAGVTMVSAITPVVMFPACQSVTRDDDGSTSAGYRLCCHVMLPEKGATFFSRTCGWR